MVRPSVGVVGLGSDHDVRAGNLGSGMNQKLLHAGGGARQKPRPSLRQEPDVLGMKTVDVFQRGDGVEHLLRLNLPRQRELHEDPVHQRVGATRCDSCSDSSAVVAGASLLTRAAWRGKQMLT